MNWERESITIIKRPNITAILHPDDYIELNVRGPLDPEVAQEVGQALKRYSWKGHKWTAFARAVAEEMRARTGEDLNIEVDAWDGYWDGHDTAEPEWNDPVYVQVEPNNPKYEDAICDLGSDVGFKAQVAFVCDQMLGGG